MCGQPPSQPLWLFLIARWSTDPPSHIVFSPWAAKWYSSWRISVQELRCACQNFFFWWIGTDFQQRRLAQFVCVHALKLNTVWQIPSLIVMSYFLTAHSKFTRHNMPNKYNSNVSLGKFTTFTWTFHNWRCNDKYGILKLTGISKCIFSWQPETYNADMYVYLGQGTETGEQTEQIFKRSWPAAERTLSRVSIYATYHECWTVFPRENCAAHHVLTDG